MKKTITLLSGVALLAAAALFSSCTDERHDITGSWASSSPATVTASIPGASVATEALTFDFTQGQDKSSGPVKMTADYDVTMPSDSVAEGISYKVTASIEGTWTRDLDDQDDYLLAFDSNSLSVAGVDAPELGPVTDAFMNSLQQFTVIEDVEVSKDATHLTFETKSPEVKYHFVKK